MAGLFGDGLFGDGTFGGLAVASSGATFSIEVAFGTAPFTEPSAWTDITDHVRKTSTRRGRNHELQKTAAGVATFTLDNLDRRFDPTNTSSPYYPNVRPMQQIRARATVGVNTYELYRGYVQDWGQGWGGPAPVALGDATCEAQAMDAFGVLQLIQLRAYRVEVLADSPVLYWPLDEPTGTANAADLGSVGALGFRRPSGSSALIGVGSYFGRSAGPFYTSSGAGCVDMPAAWTLQTAVADAAWMNPPLTFETWIQFDTNPGVSLEFANAGHWAIDCSTGRDLTLRYVKEDLSAMWSTATVTVPNTGAFHHIAVVMDLDRTSWYLDGALASSAPTRAFTAWSGNAAFAIGQTANFDGALAHVAIYDHALTAARIAAHYAAPIDALTAQLSGTAIAHLLTAVGWPAGRTFLGTGLSTVTCVADGTVLDCIQQIGEDTEHGIVEATPDGKITFIGRDVLELPGTSVVTFGDGGGAEIPYRDMELAYDDQDLWTEVVVSDAAGETFTAIDAGATTTYGRRTLSVDTVAATSNETAAQTTGLLNRYKAPAVRPTSLQFYGPRSLTQQLARAVGDRVTLARRPPGGGTLSVNAIIEGVNHDLGVDGWPMTTFALAPPDPGTFWLLGDAVYSVLGTTTTPGW